jgi:hypothetical protein
MTKYHVSEYSRVMSLLSIFGEVFCDFSVYPYAGVGYRTDISILTKKRKFNINPIPLCNIEVKNGLGLTGTDPNLQNIHYYRKITSQLPGNGINPFLLISIVGHDYLQAFGAVTTESEYISCSPLYHPLSMMFELKLNDTIEEVANFLYRINWLLHEIDDYYVSGSTITMPYFFDSRFAGVQLIQPAMYRCQFGDMNVIVKFTRTYGEDVHRFMYDEGFAPNLFMVEKLAGGWLAVVMEHTSCERVGDDEIEECKQFLTNSFLPKLSSKRYVHGDLRLPNIMKVNGKFIVLDYDWAGEINAVKFPHDINMKLSWPESVKPGKYITTISDKQTVEKLVELK